MPRNPAWEFDELVLALDLYLRNPHARNVKTDPELAELSDTLRALPLPIDRPDPTRFRNVNSCYLKLQNFKSIDPNYAGVGMKAGAQIRESVLWDHYAERPSELHALAKEIRERMNRGGDALPATPADDEEAVIEGRIVYRVHRQRERDRRVVARAKARMRHELGELRCEVCGLTESALAERYGELEGEVFECHHTRPLHSSGGQTPTRVADLAIVCPTCHRAIHRLARPVELETLRARAPA